MGLNCIVLKGQPDYCKQALVVYIVGIIQTCQFVDTARFGSSCVQSAQLRWQLLLFVTVPFYARLPTIFSAYY